MKKKEETPHERFKRLATARTRIVLERIRVLGHCSNPNLYAYTEAEVSKIFATIEKELRKTKAKFGNTSKEKEFSL